MSNVFFSASWRWAHAVLVSSHLQPFKQKSQQDSSPETLSPACPTLCISTPKSRDPLPSSLSLVLMHYFFTLITIWSQRWYLTMCQPLVWALYMAKYYYSRQSTYEETDTWRLNYSLEVKVLTQEDWLNLCLPAHPFHLGPKSRICSAFPFPHLPWWGTNNFLLQTDKHMHVHTHTRTNAKQIMPK